MDATVPTGKFRFRLRLAAAIVIGACSAAIAQETPLPPGTPLPDYAQRIRLSDTSRERAVVARRAGSLPVIVITGYWPPTNEMIRRWSNNPVQNPGGWIGGNWEGRGYDIYAFFPEFPNGIGKGEGDFEVDYQDTSGDWWTIIPAYAPIAMITFSRASASNEWELEGGNRTYVSTAWTFDYVQPRQPTPELPIMQQEPAGTERYSTLPLADIIGEVQASGAPVNAYSTAIDDSRFLSNFIGYHGNWYHALHAAVNDPAWSICSGHIHVGSGITVPTGVVATEASLRALTRYLDKRRLPGDMNCDGLRDSADFQAFVTALLDAPSYAAAYPQCVLKNGDFNGDELVTPTDIDLFLAAFTAE